MLPQYSGGLGILAGDHLKAATDLGVPIVGVGLFYKTGYFRQSLSRDGWQQETYPVLDPDGLPLDAAARGRRHAAARSRSACPAGAGCVAYVRKAQVGRVPLLLLDSDVEANDDAARSITDRLYGGGGEHRLQQEMLLGIGGVRALRPVVAADRFAGARGLPHQRGPRRFPRPGADPRAGRGRGHDLRRGARGGPRRPRSSPPTRRCRPASTASRAT